MQKKLLLALLCLPAFLLMGCGYPDNAHLSESRLRAFPQVSQFLSSNPNATIQIFALNATGFESGKASIDILCKKDIPVQPYYEAVLSSDSANLTLWVDQGTQSVACSYLQGVMPSPTGGPIEPTLTPQIVLPTTEPSAEPVGPGDNGSAKNQRSFDPSEGLREAVCDALFQNATHLVDGHVAVFFPQNFSSAIAAIGDQLNFSSPEGFVASQIPNSTNGSYYWNCWSNGGPSIHICTIPISVAMKDGMGGTITETGAIKLTFSGSLAPLISVTAVPTTMPTIDCPPGGCMVPDPGYNPRHPPAAPTPTPTPDPCVNVISPPSDSTGGESGPHDVFMAPTYYWLPVNERLPPNPCPGYKTVGPTFSRDSCEVLFDNPCVSQDGMQACGVCPYANTISVINPRTNGAVSHLEYYANLGQCKYCGTGSTCGDPDGYGLCGSGCVGNANPNIVNPPHPPVVYAVGCSGCPSNPSIYSFNHLSFDNCWYYFRECVSIGCEKVTKNC